MIRVRSISQRLSNVKFTPVGINQYLGDLEYNFCLQLQLIRQEKIEIHLLNWASTFQFSIVFA